jgi:hypothetical protein
MFEENLNEFSKQNIEEVIEMLKKSIKKSENLSEKNIKIDKDKSIKSEDILNLKNLLDSTQSIDDFLKNI